jgi:hypothetical protein
MGETMFKALIEFMLGDVGRFLLAQYNQYHVTINIIVVAYGALLIWAHMNLRQVARSMEALMIDLAQKGEEPLDVQLILQSFSKRWKESNQGRRLFFPSRNDLWFSMVDSGDLVEILNLRKEYVYVVLAKAGLLDPRAGLTKQIYRAWELYRHQLLTGIRAHHMEPDTQLNMRGKRSST